jgi:hypothetical protein
MEDFNKNEIHKLSKYVCYKYNHRILKDGDTIVDAVIRELKTVKSQNKADAMQRGKLLFAFRDYWKSSSHLTIEGAIIGFLRTDKSKQ